MEKDELVDNEKDGEESEEEEGEDSLESSKTSTNEGSSKSSELGMDVDKPLSDHEKSQGSEGEGKPKKKPKKIVIKVGLLGDSEVGKTSLMVRHVEGKFDEDYICTLGVSFMEKTVMVRNNEITFSIWDLGGQREFRGMLPRVCNDAVAILFMFDLSRKSTLLNVKEWFYQAKEHTTKSAIAMLVGTKFDKFLAMTKEEQEEITNQARKFAKAMKAPLIFTSSHESINVQKIFKIILSKAFPRHLKCTIPQNSTIGEPILEY